MSLSTTLIDIRLIMTRSQIALIVIGNIGSILAFLVFFQKKLKRNPCVVYLLAFLISNYVLIDHTMVISTLNSVFSIDPSISSIHYCRFKFYSSLVGGTIPIFFLVMASFDRVLVTSANINTRRRSTYRFAILCVMIIIIFWSIFHIPIFFYIDIIRTVANQSVCTFSSSTYTTFISYYSLICVTILPSVLLIIFATKTIYNMQRIRRNLDGRNNNFHIRQNERYLIILLLIQIMFYFVTHMLFIGLTIYSEVTKYNIKDSNQVAIERFIQYLTQYLNFLHVAFAPWINFISKNFRFETKQILQKIWTRH